MRLKIGCDPELALMRVSDGKIVSAEGLIPGDKLNPHKVKKGMISVDGFAAEIGIEPAETPEEFADNVETVLEELQKFTPGHTFVFQDHHVYDEDVYLTQSEKGRELGCDPDFNAYTRMANPTPIPNPKSLRGFAGHIHIGWAEDEDVTNPGHFADCINVVKQMDYFVGGPSLAYGRGTIRRSQYGRAGAFRVKPYGVEYRTPDNGWLVSRDRMKTMCSNVILGIERLYAGKHVYNDYGELMQKYINSGDFSYAKKYLDALDIPYDKITPARKPREKKMNIDLESRPANFKGGLMG